MKLEITSDVKHLLKILDWLIASFLYCKLSEKWKTLHKSWKTYNTYIRTHYCMEMQQINASTSEPSPLKTASEPPADPSKNGGATGREPNQDMLALVEDIENALVDLKKQLDTNESDFLAQLATLEKQLEAVDDNKAQNTSEMKA